MEIIDFTEQHKVYRKRLKDFLKNEVIPHINIWENKGITPKSIWKKMGSAGFLCPWIRPEYGGMGGDFLHSLIVGEELVRTNHTGLMAYLHSDIVVPYVDSYGSETQKAKYLPACASGDMIMAIAMTEPNSGSDLVSMSTVAIEQGDEVVLNGSKTFISNGYNCDLVIVAAKDPLIPNPHKSISLYMVPDGAPGFTRGEKFRKMGMRSQDTAELFFTNCRIPKENQLGEKGQGFFMLMQKLQQERLMVALQSIWSAEFALEWIIKYCQDSGNNGGILSTSQAIRFALAEMATEVKMGKTFVHKLVMDHMKKENLNIETAMAKFWASDLANRIAGRVLEIVGTYGVLENCPVVRTWRDVRVNSIFAGTNEIMKTIISNQIMGN